jgi:hypothetical protein
MTRRLEPDFPHELYLRIQSVSKRLNAVSIFHADIDRLDLGISDNLEHFLNNIYEYAEDLGFRRALPRLEGPSGEGGYWDVNYYCKEYSRILDDIGHGLWNRIGNITIRECNTLPVVYVQGRKFKSGLKKLESLVKHYKMYIINEVRLAIAGLEHSLTSFDYHTEV